jgi:3',5'-cyclic AMP phosphodiesterase CpdA
VRTLVISDLHLGKPADLLRRAELREPLLEAVRGVDRLVILGDGLELRDLPQRDLLGVAGDVYADLGRAPRPGTPSAEPNRDPQSPAATATKRRKSRLDLATGRVPLVVPSGSGDLGL